MSEKIGFMKLSLPLKILVVFGWFYVGLFVLFFIVGAISEMLLM